MVYRDLSSFANKKRQQRELSALVTIIDFDKMIAKSVQSVNSPVLSLSFVAVKPPTSGGGYKATP
ncbi:hypothetical protein B5J94_07075 [Moraxella lacunata]|uniref:Uncharacterized protein n=1 Tax=Moraxella lacunata TaxID=477 RepID=A0A1V4GV43_MORLA|nr:hypothetical protein [Moraxella lacunata]OPH36487.1 hypothetical protein B5J94_07075 [Moraxella lacunata]